MQIEPHRPQGAPTEWSGGRIIIEKWLARLCLTESLMQLVSAGLMLVAGILAFALTSGLITLLFLAVAFRTPGGLDLFDAKGPHTEKLLFALAFFLVVSLSIIYAYKTRWRDDASAEVNFGPSFWSASNLFWEIVSAGPIFFVLSLQDFQKYLRLERVDTPQVAAVLFWLFDKGGRVGFTQISLEFPGLNVVRVLPQFRDLPGIHWWPDDGSISISEALRETVAGLLGRTPKKPYDYAQSPPKAPPFAQPIPSVSDEMLAWYNILGLPPFATLQQVKTRYRKLAKIHHPDAKSSSGATPDDETMKRINEAYHSILKHAQNQAGSIN